VKNLELIITEYIHTGDKKTKTILVTKDMTLRLKSDVFGITVQNYEQDRKEFVEYEGYTTVKIDESNIKDDKYIKQAIEEIIKTNPKDKYIYFFCEKNKKKSLLLKRDNKTGEFIEVESGFAKYNVMNIFPKNIEQLIVIDSILDEETNIVTIKSGAGSGKTLLSVACALNLIIEQKKYSKLIVCRPTISVGEEIGFLPGNVDEKISPWMSAIFSSIDYIKTVDCQKFHLDK